ncbi:MAG: cyclic nucleotide-binding domain-containing protein [Deltaproteobacteria bacterium]|nr:MAG: cyclic nucleotide-binding domain-containing protein [Deltaproteobacteria bacterium]
MTVTAVSPDVLRSVPMFSNLSTQSLTALQSRIQIEDAPEGTLIFSEGQRGDRMYIVNQGAVQITRQIEGVGEDQMAMCREGDYFGELSLIDNAPRAANARAVEPSRLLVLRKAQLEELMFEDHAFAREFLWVLVLHLTVRLRENNEKLRAAYQMGI